MSNSTRLAISLLAFALRERVDHAVAGTCGIPLAKTFFDVRVEVPRNLQLLLSVSLTTAAAEGCSHLVGCLVVVVTCRIEALGDLLWGN